MAYTDDQRRNHLYGSMLGILGEPVALWPFTETTGATVASSGRHTLNMTPREGSSDSNLQSFDTTPQTKGLVSYYTLNGSDEWLRGTDDALYSFGNGSADEPFSLGAWVNLQSTAEGVILGKAKIDTLTPANDDREWILKVDSTGKLLLHLFDESADARIGQKATSALSTSTWSFLAATYSGSGSHDGIVLYADGLKLADGSDSSGTYTAMENGSSAASIGAIHDQSSSAYHPIDAYLGVPFLTGSQLSEDQMWTLFRSSRALFDE